jgi:hypothetical protein
VREAVLTNLWLTALNRCSPHTSVSGGKPSWLPDCLLDRNVAEYLAVLPSRDARDCARSGKLCAGFTAGPED